MNGSKVERAQSNKKGENFYVEIGYGVQWNWCY